ncbi:hypothetical protein DV495_005191 [Geotrichum candidum]|uniref:Trafficking protein particle complex subunit n=1 Tax=Geotrichum candidum TaxID=1173061 RepID=A0A0J9X4H7_GEOCN|nr:hypothetical protein DV495_005191 [Geotrichum candidum]KAI9211651.1 hypothetical protein DS838_003475 [Geotrichum bryndzae]KAF5117789.1 hypothetical protein DV454_000883 [Geotrichum candidum]KAF5119613.1 hypothetical protein DV452_001549 [Geotrichum candidum]KAF7497887.1 hypothetical protein DV113_004065 [Geotrichum candidum]
MAGHSTPIVPSSKQPAVIPRTPSSTIPSMRSAFSPAPSLASVSSASTSISTKSIYDKNLNRRAPEVSLSSFSFLFSEIIQNLQKKANGIQDLEKRLNELGYHIGQRLLELTTLRDGKLAKRETKVLGVLQLIHSIIWRQIFGKQADGLEKSRDSDFEYMLIDNTPLVSQFISVPKEMSQLNCAAFVAGIIEAILDGYQFTANVTAHTVETDEFPLRTVFLVKFEPDVVTRELSYK